MKAAARAIVIKEQNLLVMRRQKEGAEYYTLVGGLVKEGEDFKAALAREVKEETGLDVLSATPAFIEKHPEPYNEQYIYLCTVKEDRAVAIQSYSEEALLNRIELSFHEPMWVSPEVFSRLQFRTPQLQQAILKGLKDGFPTEPQAI